MEYDPNSPLFAFRNQESDNWLRADPAKKGTLTVRVGVPKRWPKWYVEKVEKPDQMYFALKNYKQGEYMSCRSNGDGMVDDTKIEGDSTWEIISVG